MAIDFEYAKSDSEPCLAIWPKTPDEELDLADWGIDLPTSPEQMENWYHSTHAVLRAEASSPIAESFVRLRAAWIEGTEHYSILSQIILHPAYQQIIALGPKAIPLILRSLQEQTDHWFWALKILNRGNDIAETAETIEEAATSWIEWGKENGYLDGSH